ncbi:DUF3870 domain-containing protein [Alicyclobacillus mengziensis]|uniref:DUF3870 domain-containing protein n=1 Tax=Alicyclobacillus mengziensis TaxID=2931921 RepID=A0A9X7VV85_9BACL|nr:DUF3870 domain-containing protein [Alicyclobacillus mengziensis]QSO45547.1 DUF3870 domain-containing protein [Alicyclobacillus mengziensis]
MSLVQRAFIAGHGKLPSGSAAKAAYDTLALVVEIEMKHAVILSVECTLATELGRTFVSNLLRGCSLKDGVDGMIDDIKLSYHGAAKGALIAALKDLETEYERLSTT